MVITETMSITAKNGGEAFSLVTTVAGKKNAYFTKNETPTFAFITEIYKEVKNCPAYRGNQSSFETYIAQLDKSSDKALVARLLNVSDFEELANRIRTELGTAPTAEPEKEISAEEKLEKGLKSLIAFFTEFEYEPSFRFVNTLNRMTSKTKALEYIKNYFSLMNHSYTTEILEKIKSAEFKNILDLVLSSHSEKVVNNRLKVYYGSAGCGKTTLAQKETENRCIICNSSMLPSDLMKDFTFKDGNPTFKKSVLWECMESGKSIVLDEINLLPYDSLRFLQGLLDNKESFEFEGTTVKIADGFKVVGTMNLTVGGSVFGLPEPLVDRCEEIRKFTLSEKDLLKSLI